MEISAADVKQYQKLCQKHFGYRPSEATARVKLLMLVRQMEIVCHPLSKEQQEQMNDVNGDDANEKPPPASDL